MTTSAPRRLYLGLPYRRFSPLLLALVATAPPSAHAGDTASPRLSFDELITLSQQDTLDPALAAKLRAVLTTPVVSNRPSPTSTPRSGGTLRVTEWNIERGDNIDGIEEMLTSPAAFLKDASKAKKRSPADMEKLRRQADLLRQSDVLILNEVDVGVKRTDYRNVVEELARTLRMSSAYAVEFLEVDPLVDLGTEQAVLDTPELSAKMSDDLKPDRTRYQGLHGNAILSRYPLTNVQVITLPVCHDWYEKEKQEISQLEKGKRKAANLVFLERITRELRRGNRNALTAEIAVPGMAQRVRIVNAHLENKCKANCRRRQISKVLEEVSDTKGPLVIAGDLNTTGTDGTPTSIRYELLTRVKDYQFWTSTLLSFTPIGLPAYATTPFNLWKNFRDPTAMHIPVVGKNPESAMFSDLEKYRFRDGQRFDFAGVAARNLEHSSKTLSDSNQRAPKGFVPTFSMKRDFGGSIKYRLDWIFVKPPELATRSSAVRAYLPEMPRTFNDLNNALSERLSDHAPIAVDMPLVTKGAGAKRNQPAHK
jgi:endonuclease/exonuclease/phosphatase family metal-dependent hydrolase